MNTTKFMLECEKLSLENKKDTWIRWIVKAKTILLQVYSLIDFLFRFSFYFVQDKVVDQGETLWVSTV
jgi:hypothetical protein